jgi:hypothetical protein
VSFDYIVLSGVYDDSKVPENPEKGCIINGPYLEGCRWNDETEVLDESKPKELYTPMPCIWLKPDVGLVSPVGEGPFFETVDPVNRQVRAAGARLARDQRSNIRQHYIVHSMQCCRMLLGTMMLAW